MTSCGLPWPPVASRGLPWPPVASRGLRDQPRPLHQVLPGLSAWATAHDASVALRRLVSGHVVSASMLAAAKVSRRPAGQPEQAVHTRMPRAFKAFENAEWGLGLQLLQLGRGADGQEAAYGHTASNGSFCLCLPAGPAVGPRTLITTFVVNCSDLRHHSEVAGRVLEKVLGCAKASAGAASSSHGSPYSPRRNGRSSSTMSG